MPSTPRACPRFAQSPPRLRASLRGWLALGICVAAACGDEGFLGDPLHRAEMRSLGPEDPGVAPGPLHRPGQPCAACHRPDGTAPPYVAAGTVYRDPAEKIAVADAEVVLTDSVGTVFMIKTNCVGNFYVRPSEFKAALPFWTSVQLGPFPFEMASPIHREASCAKCHYDPVGPASAGHIFVTDDESMFSSIVLRPCGPEDAVIR
jgi:hypothetical protein